jgi:hypothetical protein
MSNNLLVILDTPINQDAEGRFCLNDLHKAAVLSGANQRTKEPAKFLSSSQTVDLIKELTDTQNLGVTPVNVIKGNFSNGIKQGTYVVRELVYAYGMWISAKFHLQVIRAYDALITGQTFDFLKPIPEPLSLADFEWRYQVICNALHNLKKAQVTIKLTGAELLAGKCFE